MDGVVAVEEEPPVLIHEYGPRYGEAHEAYPEVADLGRFGNAGQPPPARRPRVPLGRPHAVLVVAEPAIEERQDRPLPLDPSTVHLHLSGHETTFFWP